MNKLQLQQAQRQAAPAMLGALVAGASRRFVASARLVEWHSPIINSLSRLGMDGPVKMWSLLAPFDVLCARYRETLYTPQRQLFDQASNSPDELWANYYYRILLPHVLQDNSLVRNTLRCVGGLPTEDVRMTQEAILQYFTELPLPDTAPPWAPEEASI